MLHQTCDLGPIRSIIAAILPTTSGFDVEFRFEGRLSGIQIPQGGPSLRTAELWRTTCCEVFWQPIGGTAYREFNFSPSGRWAAYDFDGYRDGMREAPVDAIAVASAHHETNGLGEMTVRANVATDIGEPAQVALNAVVEHADGVIQYWALAFGPGRPDFHSEACRQMIVQR